MGATGFTDISDDVEYQRCDVQKSQKSDNEGQCIAYKDTNDSILTQSKCSLMMRGVHQSRQLQTSHGIALTVTEKHAGYPRSEPRNAVLNIHPPSIRGLSPGDCQHEQVGENATGANDHRY